jgi:tetratricopeptide (TPR) repeat protein/tRNA A-37 threonylcarbamoyl transferase component Bud32/TolB-like protein
VDLIECENCRELLVDVFESTNEISISFDQPAEARAEAYQKASHDELSPGDLLSNRYEILTLIGEGGMGRVFKVHDRELDKTVALKLIRNEHAQDPTHIQRFKQELLLARQITHKNVVRIYDFGEANGYKFFTMEWIDGENLRKTIRGCGKLSVKEALPLARQILEALQEAHSQGVVHRDLKPHNVMIDNEGTPRILDFGIARTEDTNTMTSTGAVMGTPDYMSPEQACGEKAGPQSDLFSLGVILYEMLTGELPFQAESPMSRVVMRLTKKPTAPRELNSELPDYLERIILKCMEVERELRYQSADEVLRDLEREQVDRSFSLKIRLAAARHKPALAVTAALAIAAAVAFLAINTWRSTPSPPPPDIPVTTLAIVPFTNATGAEELDWMRDGLADMLFTDISQSRYIRPVPTERIATLLSELGVDGQSRLHEKTLDSISELAPADSVLHGQFVGSEGRLRLDLTLRKAGTGVPLHFKVEEDVDQVFGLVDQITLHVKEQFDLSPDQLKGDTDRPIAEVSTDSFEALQAYQTGLAHIRQGANQNALPLLKNAVASDPQFAMALAKLAEAYLNLGEHHQAEEVITKAQEVSEASPLPLVERYTIHAIAALVEDDLETAAKSYGELASLYPADPDIHLSLAQSLEKVGHMREAAESYQNVLSLSPGNGAAMLGLGRAQVLLGRGEEAIESLQGTLDTGHFDDDLESMGMIHSIMGVAFRDTGRLDEAIDHLKSSLEYRRRAGDIRGQSTTLTNLAAVYEHQGDIEKALEAEREAVSLARQIGDRHAESLALLNLGLTHKAGGDLDKALEALRESLRIEMDRQDQYNLGTRLNYIADIYRIRGQYDDALVYLEQAKGHIASSGHQHEKAINLEIIGLVKKSQGSYEEAIEAFLEALPNYQEVGVLMGVASVQTQLSAVYSSQGRYADAHRSLVKSIDIYKELGTRHHLAEAKTHLGDFYITLGKFKNAQKQIDGAWSVAEESRAEDIIPLIRLARGRRLGVRGHLEKAEADLVLAQQLSAERGDKELSLRSRIELGRMYLGAGRTAEADELLREARLESKRAGLSSLEAAAAAHLADVYETTGRYEEAYATASQALDIAERYSGRPIVFRARAILAAVCEKLDRKDEVDRHLSEVVSTFEWILGNLDPAHVESYMNRPDVQTILMETLDRTKRAGRHDDTQILERWVSTKK